MILWFFDSWLWWKLVMEIFRSYFPDIDMILEMDRENAPYGDKTQDEIRRLTKAWVQKLFDRGADVVILACNTASVHALRWLQQEIFLWKHILGVTVPGAEAVVEWWYQKIGVLATEATVRTRMYRERVHILDDGIWVEEIAAPGLVPLIEQGIISWPEINDLLRIYLSQFSSDIEALVLGCTHYPLIRESIEHVWKEIHAPILPLIRGSQRGLEKIWFQQRFSQGIEQINYGFITYNPELKTYARENRKSGNLIQEQLWSLLRWKRIGYKFHREKPIGEYIVDFYSSELKLAIEIDGESHLDIALKDTERTRFLNALWIHVLRYSNKEVMNMLEGVKEDILYWISQIRQPTLTLPCQGGDQTQSKPTLTLPCQGGDPKKLLDIIDPGVESARKFRDWMRRRFFM
jgi:glutamate racemase